MIVWLCVPVYVGRLVYVLDFAYAWPFVCVWSCVYVVLRMCGLVYVFVCFCLRVNIDGGMERYRDREKVIKKSDIDR